MIRAPTIADLRARGHTGARIVCLACHDSQIVAWDDIGLSDATPVPDIALHRGFACRACGSRDVAAAPIWSGKPSDAPG